MRAFLCSIDESVWDAIDIGWTRPKVANPHGIRQHSPHLMLIVKHLTQFSVVYLQMSFTGFLTLPLPKKHGRNWKPPMKARKK